MSKIPPKNVQIAHRNVQITFKNVQKLPEKCPKFLHTKCPKFPYKNVQNYTYKWPTFPIKMPKIPKYKMSKIPL